MEKRREGEGHKGRENREDRKERERKRWRRKGGREGGMEGATRHVKFIVKIYFSPEQRFSRECEIIL